MSLKVSIIIPALNEGVNILSTLEPLSIYRTRGHEVIVVDGGSQDDTMEQAAAHVDLVIQSTRGRALQMNAGAAEASGDILLFLHADTQLPENALIMLQDILSSKRPWGRFDVRLSGQNKIYRVIEFMMNWRSRLSGIATGDQAIFVMRDQFEALGGFPNLPLMEDITFSQSLKRLARPICIRTPLTTSSRRWEKRGVLPTIILMWRLRLLYWFGVDAKKLAELYR